MEGAIRKNIFIFCLALIFFVSLKMNASAAGTFYHGRKPQSPGTNWQKKETEHFEIMYRDRYFDPEQILEALSVKFGIPLVLGGGKVKLFISEDAAYTIVGGKTIYADSENSFIHELTHVLFLQLNRHAPSTIAEGIALYAQLGDQGYYAPDIDVQEIIALEKNLGRSFRTSSGKMVLGAYSRTKEEKESYIKGFCFVSNIIKEKGLESFKEFYKHCSFPASIQTAWEQVYGMPH